MSDDDKFRKEVEGMIKKSMVGGRLSLSLLATHTQERVQQLTEQAGHEGANDYYTSRFTLAQREVLGVVESDYKPSKDAVRLVKMAGPETAGSGSLNKQGYVFFDEATAKRIDKAHFEVDKQISNVRSLVHVAQGPKSIIGGTEIMGSEKTDIEAGMKRFIESSKAGLDDYAKEQIAATIADLKAAKITDKDDVLGDEIKQLNAMIAKNKTTGQQR